jgi:hypothetical protein
MSSLDVITKDEVTGITVDFDRLTDEVDIVKFITNHSTDLRFPEKVRTLSV